jgi:hypothetical protein
LLYLYFFPVLFFKRKEPKESAFLQRRDLYNPSRINAQEYVHPTTPLRRSASGGTMPTPRLKLSRLSLLWLQKGQNKTALFAAFEKSPPSGK